MANTKAKEYRALTGLDFTTGVGEDVTNHHYDAGDKMTDVPENVLKTEKAAGNIEEWVERQTENVKDLEDGSVLMGVMENRKGVLEEVNLNGA